MGLTLKEVHSFPIQGMKCFEGIEVWELERWLGGEELPAIAENPGSVPFKNKVYYTVLTSTSTRHTHVHNQYMDKSKQMFT